MYTVPVLIYIDVVHDSHYFLIILSQHLMCKKEEEVHVPVQPTSEGCPKAKPRDNMNMK